MGAQGPPSHAVSRSVFKAFLDYSPHGPFQLFSDGGPQGLNVFSRVMG
jgi:hypothetical protein